MTSLKEKIARLKQRGSMKLQQIREERELKEKFKVVSKRIKEDQMNQKMKMRELEFKKKNDMILKKRKQQLQRAQLEKKILQAKAAQFKAKRQILGPVGQTAKATKLAFSNTSLTSNPMTKKKKKGEGTPGIGTKFRVL